MRGWSSSIFGLVSTLASAALAGSAHADTTDCGNGVGPIVTDLTHPEVSSQTVQLSTGRTVVIALRNSRGSDNSFAEVRSGYRNGDRVWIERSADCGASWFKCGPFRREESNEMSNELHLMRACFQAGDTGQIGCTDSHYEDGDGELAQCTPPAPLPPPPPINQTGQLKVLSSKMCLVARVGSGERPVVQVPCAGYADQLWTLHYIGGGGPEGTVQIVNVDRRSCLVTRGSGESRAVMTTCNEDWRDQVWDVIRDPNTGYYQLRDEASGLCLVVRTDAAETQAVQSVCGMEWADQLWIWEGWF